MQVIFLGTNGWYDSPTGNTICTLINSDKYHIILDAGNCLYKADRYIKDDLPVFLFLSHFHLDHIEGLHVLSTFCFLAPSQSPGRCRHRPVGGREMYLPKDGAKVVTLCGQILNSSGLISSIRESVRWGIVGSCEV